MAFTASLPHRFPNILRRTGRAIFAACFWACIGFLLLMRGLWYLCGLLLTGGSFGTWVEREFPSYYKTEHWKHVRFQALHLSGHLCAVCADHYRESGKKLFVRHRHHYHAGKSVFHREDPQRDLIVLCEDHCMKGKRVHDVAGWKTAYRWYGTFQR